MENHSSSFDAIQNDTSIEKLVGDHFSLIKMMNDTKPIIDQETDCIDDNLPLNVIKGNLSNSSQFKTKTKGRRNVVKNPSVYKRCSSSANQKENRADKRYGLRARAICSVSDDCTFMNEKHKINVFTCSNCSKRYTDKRKWEKHKRNKKLLCNSCDISFCSKSSLVRHILSNCEKEFPCRACEVSFKTLSGLTKHRKNHLKCCGLKFENRFELMNHKCKKKTYTCDICKRNYVRLKLLIKHIDKHNILPYCCTTCKKMFVSNDSLTSHKCDRDCKNKTPMFCDKCGKSFVMFEKLKIHVLKHEGLIYKCEKCYKNFSSQELLDLHKERVDCSQSVVECPTCGKVYRDLISYKKHINSHSDNILKCYKCKKVFIDSVKFKKHRESSDCKQPLKQKYECDECGSKFCNLRLLMLHILKIHQGLEYKCNVCGAQFINPEELEQHSPKTCLPEGPCTCATCGKVFTKQEYLKKHAPIHLKQIYKCPHCYSVLMKRTSFEKHMAKLDCSNNARKQKLAEYNFKKCRFCLLEFESETLLSEHFNSYHPDQELHECFVCSQGIPTYKFLTEHIHQHNLDKYTCAICKKHYTSQEGLRKHRLKHKGAQLKCKFCDSEFLKESRFQFHVRTCRKNPESGYHKSVEIQNELLTDPPKRKRQLNWESHIIMKHYRGDPLSAVPNQIEMTNSGLNAFNFFDDRSSDEDSSKAGWFDQYYEMKDKERSTFDKSLEMNDLIRFDNVSKVKEEEEEEDDFDNNVVDNDEDDDDDDLYVKNIESSTSGSSSDEDDEDIPEEPIDYNPKKCRICLVLFSQEYELLHHFIRCHPKQIAHKCPNCEVEYPLFAQLKEHMKDHGVGIGIFNCNNCSKKYKSEKKMVKHTYKCKGLVEGTSKELFDKDCCRKCGKTFNTKCGFKRHKLICKARKVKEKKKIGEKKKELPIPIETYDDEWREPEPEPDPVIENENEVITDEGNATPKIEKTEEKSNDYIAHLPPMDSFSCRLCDKKFQYVRGLVMHFKNEHPGQKALVCPVCNIQLADKLNEHLKTHGIGEEFICELCNKKFNQKFLSKIHEMWHQGIEYKCSMCKQKFLNQEKMEKHIQEARCRNRESLRKLPCEVCGKSYKSKFGLAKHFMTHTPKELRPIKNKMNCEYCGKWFDNNNGLIRHRRIHTGERPYCCKFCPKAFAQEGNCKAHERIHTGESKPRKKRVTIQCQNTYFPIPPPFGVLVQECLQDEDYPSQL